MKKPFLHSKSVRIILTFMLFALAFWMRPAEAMIIEGMEGEDSLPAVLDRENPEIKAVMAIQEHYSRALFALPDVVGTATGLNEQGNPAVVVFTKGIGAKGVPGHLQGVPVVVKMTGEFYAYKPGRGGDRVSTTSILTPPVPIGVSTGNENECSAGTIGARVTDDTNTNYYALSNNHVYALENKADNYTRNWVLQPGRYDTQCSASGNKIGELADYVPINFGSGDNLVDAALALVYTGPDGKPMVGNATLPDGYGTPSSEAVGPVIGMAVEKYGRTTKLTVGTITGINATIVINFGASGNATFSNQIIVQSAKPFLKAGDSGSLLVTTAGLHPVGLIFAGDSSGKYAVANDINEVLNSLSVKMGANLKIDGN